MIDCLLILLTTSSSYSTFGLQKHISPHQIFVKTLSIWATIHMAKTQESGDAGGYISS